MIFIQNLFAQDSIQFCRILPQTNSFIAVANSYKTIQRHQLATFNLLTTFQVSDKSIIAIAENESNNLLYAISKSSLYTFNLTSGELENEVGLPNSITSDLVYNLQIIKDKQLIALDTTTKQLAIATGVNLFILNAETGDSLSHFQLSSIPDFFTFTSNGTKLVYTLSQAQSVYEIDIASNKKTEVFACAKLVHFSFNKDQTKAIAINRNASTLETEITYFNVYNGKLKKATTTQIKWPTFNPENTALFYNTNLVINKAGYSLLKYINQNDGSIQTLDFGLTITGFDQKEYEFLIWNQNQIKLFNSNGTELGCLPTLSSYSHDFTSHLNTLKPALPIIDSGITSLAKSNESWIEGKQNGDIKVNNKIHHIIYTPVTAVHPFTQDTIYAAGRGRCISYNLNTNASNVIFRGIEGIIIHIALSKSGNYVALANQEGTVYLFKNKGSLVCKLNATSAIKQLTFKTEKTLLIRHTNNTTEELILDDKINEFENESRQLLINTHHTKIVQNCTFNPDGKQLLTSDLEGEIKLWDVQSLVVLNSAFIEDVSHAIFSPDGSEILAYGLSTFYLLDAKSLEIKQELPIPPYYKNQLLIGDVAFINDNVAAFSELKYGSILFLNINSGDVFYAYSFTNSHGIYAIAADLKNNRLATFGEDSIHVLNTDVLSQYNAVAHPNSSWENIYVNRLLTFSPEKTKLLAEQDTNIVVYSYPDLNPIKTFIKAQNAHFLNENEVVVLTDIDKYSGRFEFAKYNLTTDAKHIFYSTKSYNPKKGSHISNMASFGNLLAIQYSNGYLEILNGTTMQHIRQSTISLKNATLCFNPKDGRIASSAANRTDLYEWRDATKNESIGHNFKINTMQSNFVYSPKGSYYLKVYSNYIEVLDNSGLNILHKLEGEFGDKFVFDENEKWVLIWDIESLFKYNLESGKLQWKKLINTKEEFMDNVFANKQGEIIVLTRRYITDVELYQRTNKRHSFHLTKYNQVGSKLFTFEINANMLGASSLADNTLIFENSWGDIALLDITTKKMEVITDLDQIDDIYLMPDLKDILITNDKGEIRKINITSKQVTLLPQMHSGQIKSIDFYDNYLLSNAKDGKAIIWEKSTFKPLLNFVQLTNEAYAFYTDSLYYAGTPSISKAFFFKQNNQVYPFEQFDLLYNRPDKIIAQISENEELVTLYEAAYNKRIQNTGPTLKNSYNLSDIPTVQWDNPPDYPETNNASLSLTYTAKANKNDLKKIQLWINNVPLFGIAGKGVSGRNISKTEQVTLSVGSNKIELSVTDNAGIESLRKSFVITYNPDTLVKQSLHIVALAVSDYDGQENDLKYAVKDGRDFIESFLQNHSKYASITVDSLFDNEVTQNNLGRIKSNLKNSKVDDAVVVFVAGHGLLDTAYNFYYATPTCNFKQPSEGGISYTNIESLLDNIPARKKLLLMDACHSGQVDKTLANNQQLSNSNKTDGSRGVVVVDDASSISLSNSFELMGELFVNLERGSGTQVISAATGDGSALERDDWNNGAFTYTVLNALKQMNCDNNEDGNISVTELRDYVIPEVYRLTNGLQKPTVRQENIEFDWPVW